jgi:coenzyme Q-binding protein COQ10
VPSFLTSRRVRHKPADMFNLVADVESYPEFVPLCETLKIKRREKDGECDVIIASMTVAYKMFRESFGSRVVLDPHAMEIRVTYLDGPFQHLENRWTFRPDAGGCEVGFFISYEFRSKMLAMLMGAVFDKAFRKFSAAFELRADKVYAAPAATSLKAPPPVEAG